MSFDTTAAAAAAFQYLKILYTMLIISVIPSAAAAFYHLKSSP
jgi:hypothetical protein